MPFFDERLPMRVWSKATPEPNTGCWLWLGCLSGHPQVRRNGVIVNLRRWALEIVHGGSIEAETVGGCLLECFNPAHLVAGGASDVAKAYHRRFPHLMCANGHYLPDVGTYALGPSHPGAARCRQCAAIIHSAKRARQFAAAVAPLRRSKSVAAKIELMRRLNARTTTAKLWETRPRRDGTPSLAMRRKAAAK